MRFLGAHLSTAGGLPTAIERGVEIGCTAAQIFVKNPNQWVGRAVGDEEITVFREARRASAIGPIVAHAAYLVNLCAADETVLERSRRGLADELARAARLGLDGLVVHPGAHLGQGESAGLDLVAASIDAVLADHDLSGTRLLLEVTAGQGTVLGSRLEQLERILESARTGDRLGICLDTCHLFAAGYPLHTARGVDDLLAEVRSRFGRERLGCVHLNDSRFPLGSRRDRHANIGDGEIGIESFRHLLAHPAVADLPLILETPRGSDGNGHRRDLERLRTLAARGRERARPSLGAAGANLER